jgi:hypothetical protein
MIGSKRKAAIDRIILRKLSLYESLNVLQLWYELREDDALREHVTEKEISKRLDSLRERGFIELITRGNGDESWAMKRGGIDDDLGDFKQL